MRHRLPVRVLLGLGVLVAGGSGAASVKAQPPGPPPSGEYVAVRGTVRGFTTAPKGEVDGFLLSDGRWVHWPPHLQGRFADLVARGDPVKATGYWETGPKGDTKLEVSTLTNL